MTLLLPINVFHVESDESAKPMAATIKKKQLKNELFKYIVFMRYERCKEQERLKNV